MRLQLTRIYGVVIAALAILGLTTSGHLFGLTNSDMLLDIARLGLAAYLLYAGFISHSRESVNSALLLTGTLYIVLGAVGLINPTLGGLLPSGLTGFDVAFHLITGAVAVFAVQHRDSNVAARV